MTTVFFLPGLGLMAESGAGIAARLGERCRFVSVGMPGHGGVPDAADESVSALADAVLATVQEHSDGGPWILCAHSMGGKVAAVVASRMPTGLAGLVLLAPSPPTPEPMAEERRALMLTWAERGAIDVAAAEEFVSANVSAPLPDAVRVEAVRGVTQTTALAWRRWLEHGSKEDVSAAVGVVDLPVTVLAGEDDDDLGADAQPELLRTIYPRARFVRLPATGHLIPFENPQAVADEIVRMAERA